MTLFDERPIRPMLAKDGKPFDSKDYFFEPKWDGLRAILFFQKGVVILREDGVPDFGRLQARFGVEDPKRVEVLGKTTPVTYVAFDLLHLDGQDIINRPLLERKKRLKSITREGPYLLYGDHIEGEGTRFFKEATSHGFEGIIAKETRSQYVPGLRTDYWIKIKQIRAADCVIVGFSDGGGVRATTFGSYRGLQRLRDQLTRRPL